jgi:fructokinase
MIRLKVLTCGFVVADLIVADLPALPIPGYIVWAPRGIRLRTGGHPTNVSIDLIQMGLRKGDVGIVGVVGDDVFGHFIENYLKSKNVVTFLEKTGDYETSKCIALVVKGEDRRFIAEPGANECLKIDTVVEKILETSPQIFYQASGILGEYDYKIKYAFEVAKKVGALIMLDFVQPYKKGWDYLLPSISYADIIHCNDIELKQFTGTTSIEDGVHKLAELGVKLSIISLGAQGLYAYFAKERTLIRQDAFKVNVVDPTGAGDALSAGIMYKLLQMGVESIEDLSVQDIVLALQYGQAAGAACVTEAGTTPGVTRENIERILKEHGEEVLNSTKIINL